MEPLGDVAESRTLIWQNRFAGNRPCTFAARFDARKTRQ